MISTRMVPAAVLREQFRRDAPIGEGARRLARSFKVSALAALRRVHNIGELSRDEFWEAYRDELDRLGALDQGDAVTSI